MNDVARSINTVNSLDYVGADGKSNHSITFSQLKLFSAQV